MATNPEGKPPAEPEVRQIEQAFPSTTFAWRKVRISRAPQASVTVPRKGRRWYHLPPWPRRKPLHLTIVSRGGPEAWVEIHCRGSMGRFPGHVALIDVCQELWG